MLRNPYLILFIILMSIGITSAYAINITLGGTVDITQILNMMENRITNVGNPTNPSDAATKSYVDSAPGTDTLALLGCTANQVAKFDGNNWGCKTIQLKTNPMTTLDSTQGTEGMSIVIGTDGNPVISYYGFGGGDLNFVKCENPSCSENSITSLDSDGIVGRWNSIAIGTDGNPVISYHHDTNKDLKVLKCGNPSCSSGNNITIVDSIGSVGQFTSIAIGTDDNPVISYWDGTNSDLKVLKCGNPSCSDSNIIVTVDSTGFVGEVSSIAIGTDGLPVISYLADGDLKVVKCGNTICSTNNIFTVVDNSVNTGESSIAIGTDGNPVISYYDSTNTGLKIAKCGNSSCSTNNLLSLFDSDGNKGISNSIAIGRGGNPVISYYDGTNGDLKIAKCANPLCSGGTATTLASTGNVGSITSIAVGVDGNPVIVYTDYTIGHLNLIVDGTVLIFE